MAEQSWWLDCDRETFRAKVNDPERLARLRTDRSFTHAGWGDEGFVVRVRPKANPLEWTPPATRPPMREMSE